MNRRWRQGYRGFVLYCFFACLGVSGSGSITEAQAVTIYSYIDDQGNPVYTDTPETIPEQYRAKVKTHERPDPVTAAPSTMESVKERVKAQVKNLGRNAPTFPFKMDGLSAAQSQILTYAGAAAIVLLVIMYLSKSQMVRMLGFSLLIVVGIGAPVLMYVSDGGPMEVMKSKAEHTGQVQQERLQQAPQ
ncbi:MAG TPA: DUF4124 domain-containing protein [Nitrospira sp.]|nr:DUF4124 domain-containing protein [Nitrospira sp.]